jgi:hypothetical protein
MMVYIELEIPEWCVVMMVYMEQLCSIYGTGSVRNTCIISQEYASLETKKSQAARRDGHFKRNRHIPLLRNDAIPHVQSSS